MIKSRLATALLAAALACLLAPAQSQTDGTITGHAGTISQLKLTVKTDQATYHSGHKIRISVELKNPTATPISMSFADGQRYEVVFSTMEAGKSHTVWTWSHGMMFNQMVGATTVQAGKSIQFTAFYPSAAKVDTPDLKPGVYTALATITTMGKDPRPTARTKFTVK